MMKIVGLSRSVQAPMTISPNLSISTNSNQESSFCLRDSNKCINPSRICKVIRIHLRLPYPFVPCKIMLLYKTRNHNMPKILIVDDDITITELMKALVKMEGHEPTTVNDSLQAMEIAKSLSPDLITLD